MKKPTAILIAVMAVAIVAVAVVSVISFLEKSDSNEIVATATETAENVTVIITEQVTVKPADGFIINPESFLPEETSAKSENKTESETRKEVAGGESGGDYLSTLSDNDIKMLNIFLSNFSEACVENIDTSDMSAMIDFVCLNTLINYRENINYTDGQDVINPENGHRYFSWLSEEYIAERVDRFFDVELVNTSTEDCYYYDGKYYYIGTDGDTYADFTKVTSATENSDGTITVEYDVYWYKGDTYDQPPSYAYEGIGSENLNGKFEYRYSGTAVVKSVHLGGEGYANYKLVSLEKK